MNTNITPSLGRAALRALIKERSPLGPLRVMAAHVGRFFQLPLPGFKPYIVFGPEAARQVLVTDRAKFLWRNRDPVTDLLGQGVLVVDGEEHDRYRTLMEPPLHPARLPDHTARFIFHTDRVSAQWKDGAVIDLLVESRKIALLIIMDALFSVEALDDLPRLWKPIRKAIEFISPGAWILWRQIPRWGFKKPLRELDEYLYGIISDRRRLTADRSNDKGQPSAVSRQDLLQHLLDAGLDNKLIRDQMLTMLIAGHDTSTALLAWTFALLGQHPEIHQRVIQEVDTLERSPLLDQVIKEALRLYPPIHIGNRSVTENVSFGENQTMPAGARMFYSIYLTHRDPEIWENAESFCPERFTHGRKTPPLSYIPFGGGPRACIGAAFGQAEARVVLARLFHTHTFEFTHHKIRPHMGATLEPRPGVKFTVSARRERK